MTASQGKAFSIGEFNWVFVEPVFRARETYAVATDVSEAAAKQDWVSSDSRVYVVADEAGGIVGTYYLKAKQAGPGSHVCNCGYIVARGVPVRASPHGCVCTRKRR